MTGGGCLVSDEREEALGAADVTPKAIYDRRKFLAGLIAAGGAFAGLGRLAGATAGAPVGGGVPLAGFGRWPGSTDEAITPVGDVTTYNNFYEFGTDKSD